MDDDARPTATESSHLQHYPDSKVRWANMGPSWVLLAPDGLHVGPKNLAIRVMTRPCPPLGVLLIIWAFSLSRDYKYTNRYFRFDTNSSWQELMASITRCQYQQSVVNEAPPVLNTNCEQSTRFIMCWHCVHFTATSLYGVTYWFIDAHGRQWTGLLWLRARISVNLFTKFVAHYMWHISKSSITWTDADYGSIDSWVIHFNDNWFTKCISSLLENTDRFLQTLICYIKPDSYNNGAGHIHICTC